VQITRRRRSLTGRWRTETVYAVTDLDHGQIRPDELANIIRGHWGIENRRHWIRDVTFTEDLSQIRTDHGPAVMATMRNLAISVHRRHGTTNIAAATRTIARHPTRVLPLLL
jgi:predicted transposase YbfD/YdcC